MARAKSPFLGTGASKQLGHSLIYKQKGSRSFVTRYNKPGGKNPAPASPTQLNQRMIYNFVIARWQAFSTAEKAVWNTDSRAKSANISGWNLFLKEALADLPTYLGIQGYWSFNRIVGGKILDLSGNENHGALGPAYPANAPTLVDSINPKFGKAGNFDGSDDYIKTDKTITINTATTNYTLSACFNKQDQAGHNIIFGIFPNFVINIENNNKIRAWLNGWSTFIDVGPIIDGWHKITALYTANAVAQSRKIYLDGVYIGTDHGVGGGNYSGTDNLRIGRQENWGAYATAFLGKIDDVLIYDRLLGENEIKSLHGI